jgi:cytochrome c oxidase subunit 4
LKADEHILSYGQLLVVLSLLLVLTIITIGISMIDLGAGNVWAALLIACTKASLVLLFFMHLKYEKGWVVKASFLSTFGFLAILIGFIFWDISFR